MGSRHRLFALAIVAGLLVSFGLDSVASAATTSSTPPTSVAISGNFAFSGAVITGPGLSRPRKLNAYQSAVYVQSWLGSLYSGVPVVHADPPAGLGIYEVEVTGNWAGSIETRATFYASDGRRVWIAFPALEPITSTPVTRPAKIRGWFVALPRVRQAFLGTAKLVPTAGTQTPSTTVGPTTTVPAGAPAGHSGTAAGPWIAIALVVVVLGAAFFLFRSRRRKRDRGAP